VLEQQYNQSRNYKALAWVIVVHALFIQITLLLGYLSKNMDASKLIYPSCCLFLAFFIWSVASWKLVGGDLFSPYIMFLLAAGMFNGGQLLLEVFRLNPNGILENQFTSDALLRTIIYVLLGLTLFHLGALVSRFHSFTSLRRKLEDTDIRIVGWGLFVVAIVPAVMLLKDAITAVMSSNILALYGNDDPTGFHAIPLLLSKLLIPSALFILAGSRKSRFGVGISFVIVLSYTLIMFVLGLRSAAIMPLLAYIWLYDRLVRRIPRIWIVLIGSIVFFLIFPIIAVFRTQSLATIDIAGGITGIDNPALAIISEVGNSMLTVAHTMDLIPLIRDYDLGQGYLYALLTIVPNFFWELHPSVAHGLAADWLSWQIDPGYASIGGGYGYSFIAETFFNFGWYGVLLMGAIGYTFARFARSAEETNSAAKLAMFACFLSFFLIIARGETASIVRPLVWYSLFPYCAIYLVNLLRRRNS
jgi:oligosaccharide repeat unit polymerase